MSRKNIFEVLESQWDIMKEIRRIDSLVYSTMFKSIKSSNTYRLYEFCDSFCFVDWKQRNNLINCYDMYKALNLYNFLNEEPTINKIIDYLEFIENIIVLCGVYYQTRKSLFSKTNEYSVLCANIDNIIEKLNLELNYNNIEQKMLITEKSATITAVVEVIDSPLAIQVIEYNHHMLKGDIERKRRILLALSQKLDAIRADIPTQISNEVFFLMNNLNIRHNNMEQGCKDYKSYTDQMSSEELETWYDETYQTALLAILLVDHKTRSDKVLSLKEHY